MHGPEVPVAHVVQPLPPAAQPKLKFGVGGGVAWHIALQFACVCVPLASTVHAPVVSEQLYMGGGVGGGGGGGAGVGAVGGVGHATVGYA